MSSETSTRREPGNGETAQGPEDGLRPSGFQPWHLFVIATLFAASATAVAVRGTSPTNVIFVCLTVLAAGVAGYAAYRTLAPLVQADLVEVPEMVGGRTRAALEREKTLVLRAIKELEFDRAMGKVSEADWQEMTARLRARAVRLIRQLDSGRAVYRDLIEKELTARAAAAAGRGRAAAGGGPGAPGPAVVLALALGLLGAGTAAAQMGGMGGTGMPDARAMSGIPLSSETVPAGAVSVRLVRGEVSNLITDHPVEFVVDGQARTVKTDATGHAVLSGVAAGATVQASATVDGERLESQAFQVSAGHGTAVMLVATDKSAAQQMAKEAVPGTVVIGGQSRLIVQFDDEVLQAFYVLEIANAGPAPVTTPGPLVFEMPEGAQNTSLVEGSSPAATLNGARVSVAGPFPPGSTSVQVAFQMPPGARARFRLPLPAAWLQPALIVEKAGSMGVSSPQLQTQREANEGGKAYVLAMGSPLKAGDALAFDVTGLPHHPAWPRTVALALAVLLLLAGAWASVRRGANSGESAARQVIERRRERVFGELLRLDQQLRSGAGGAEAAARRAALVAELERIYGELDSEGRAASGQGLAA